MKVEKTNIEEYKYDSINHFYVVTFTNQQITDIKIYTKDTTEIMSLLPQQIMDLSKIFYEQGLEHNKDLL